MKTIKYSPLIHRIGVELEGLYTDTLSQNLSSLAEKGAIIANIGTDGSVYRDDYNHAPREVRTKPLPADELSTLLRLMDTFQKKGSYKINASCGLHYHISLTSQYAYSQVCTPAFFAAYREMFNTHFPAVYSERAGNSYCASDLKSRYGLLMNDEETTKKTLLLRHFRRQSSTRYTLINYCFLEHGTIEFRGYGGTYANFSELAELIQRTIDLITAFSIQKTGYKKALELAINTPDNRNMAATPRSRYGHTITVSYDKKGDKIINIDCSEYAGVCRFFAGRPQRLTQIKSFNTAAYEAFKKGRYTMDTRGIFVKRELNAVNEGWITDDDLTSWSASGASEVLRARGGVR